MQIADSPTIRRAFVVAFWAALLFAFVMAALPKPPPIPGDPPDKVLHIIAFLVLAALAVAAFRATSLIAIGVRLSAFGVMIELIQTIPALRRDGDIVDWIADTLAVTMVLMIARAMRSRNDRTRRLVAEEGLEPPTRGL